MQPNRPLLSLCMIVRDSAQTLPACLASMKPWVDELIVVDTGSQDETRQLAQSFGARLYTFDWIDDFAAARNESLKHASGEWICWVDSDDTIDADNGRKLRELAYSNHPAEVFGYVMQVHCPGGGHGDVTVVDHVKLFRNDSRLRFEGRIHEQILMPIRRVGGEVRFTDIYVVHSGADYSPAGRRRKFERDLRILFKQLDDEPEHGFVLFNLGMTYSDQESHSEAAAWLERSREASQRGESHVRKLYALLAHSYHQLGQQANALEICSQGRALFPDDVELAFRHGVLLHDARRFEEAAETYQHVLSGPKQRNFQSVDRGITGYKAHHNLAVLRRDMQQFDLAEVHWRLAVELVPSYRLGWQELIETLLQQRRFTAAFLEIERLKQLNLLPLVTLLAAARVAEVRGKKEDAKALVQEACQLDPAAEEPWQALSRICFQSGDFEAAKRSLRELLKRQPQDAAAYHNLGQILQAERNHLSAVEHFRKSLTFRPESSSTQALLQQSLAALGQTKDSSVVSATEVVSSVAT
jgi:O-antigen biosynthesis protein